MAGRKRTAGLTEAEHRIMRVLWEQPGLSVGEVTERIEGPARPAYNSVLTIMRILERKGYVTHAKSGRAFTYSPVLDRQQARKGALTQLLHRFFNGSREALVMDLLGHEEVDETQLQRVRELLGDAEAHGGTGDQDGRRAAAPAKRRRP